MAINILDSMTINRISAGEVVESPFSIVKELIDNSLDAGATKISIEILNGGIDYIKIKDNGHGIEKDDLIKAFLPHATSKLKDISDLDSISTLGFRGEALASISNVSQTRVVSITKDSDCAYSLEVNGGVFSEITPESLDEGTKIEVNNLFYNTPARRKFLKKPKAEESQITNIVSRYILAHPNVVFKYSANGKIIFQSTGKSLLDAIYCVYGAEFTQNIMHIDKTIGNLHLYGYVSKVGYSKPNTTYQTLMINSRYVIDEIVSKAVYMANEEYLMTRQFPVYILNLDMPAIDVDVNVHPSKMNVKFANPSKIYDLVYTAVRAAIYNFINPRPSFSDNSLQNSIDVSENLIKTDINSLKEIELEPTAIKPNLDYTLRQTSYSPITIFDLKNELKSENPNNVNANSEKPYIPANTENSVSNIELDKNNTITSNENTIETNNQQVIDKEAKVNNEDKVNNKDYINIEDSVEYKIVGQLFNEFLILEYKDNMLLIDFHAGHERLNYDKFTEMVNKRDVVVQNLLIPYVHELTSNEVEFILTLKDELSNLGFDIDSFGDNKIIINAVPMQLKDINLKEYVNDLVHDMKNLRPNMNNEIRHYLMQKACKSSVRSGQTLNEMEIKELLKNLDMKNPVLLCPHGRPVITVINRAQIEKWFKRIV